MINKMKNHFPFIFQDKKKQGYFLVIFQNKRRIKIFVILIVILYLFYIYCSISKEQLSLKNINFVKKDLVWHF